MIAGKIGRILGLCLIGLAGLANSSLANSMAPGNVAEQISTTLKTQIRRNHKNDLIGRSRDNNYVIVIDPRTTANGAKDDPSLVQNVFRNGGDYFWPSVDPNGLNQTILGDANLLQGTQYYMVIASIFLYGDTAFSGNANQQDWAKIKAAQMTTTSNNQVSGGDDQGFTNYCNQLFSYVKTQVQAPMGTTDYVVNYYLTIFTRSHGKYKVSYRTYISVGSAIQGFSKGFPALNGQLNNGTVTSKQDWLNNNINSDAAYIDLYKKNGGDLSVVDFTGTVQPQDMAALKQLFGGKSPISEDNTHTLVCRLFIVDAGDPDLQSKLAIYTAYIPPQGQMAMLLELTNGNPSVKDDKFGDAATQKNFTDAMSAIGDQGTDMWTKFTSYLHDQNSQSYTFANFCQGLYEMMDFFSKGLSHLEIPARAWNCRDPNYDGRYSQWFNYLMLPFTFATDMLVTPYLEKYAPKYAADFKNAPFACLAGVWNGIIGFGKSIPDGIKLLTSAGSPTPEWTNIQHLVAQKCDPGNFNDASMCFTGFVGVVWDGIKDQHNIEKNGLCQFSYALGNDALMIATIYFTANPSVLGEMASMMSFLEVAQKFDLLGQIIGKSIGLATNIFMEAGGKLLVVAISNGAQEVFRIVEENGVKAFYLVNATAKSLVDFTVQGSYELVTVAGTRYKLSFMDVLTPNLENAQLKIKQYLEDADGNIVRDGNGKALAVVGPDPDAPAGTAGVDKDHLAVVEDADWEPDLDQVQKINGRYPINSQDYTGKNFSFDLTKNPPATAKMLDKTAAKAAELKSDFEELLAKYPDGVDFDEFGYPRFEKYTVEVNGKPAKVTVQTAGNRKADFAAADAQVGIDEAYRQKNNLVWHHVEDTRTMLLVPQDLHDAVKHTGGIAVFKNDVSVDIDTED